MKKLLFLLIIFILISIPVEADNPNIEDIRSQSAQSALHSVVKIQIGFNHGTGFYIAENRVITNFHVIKGHTKIPFTTFTGKECTGYLLYAKERKDIAVLKTDCKGEPLPITDHHYIGQPVIVIGHPGEYDYSVSFGYINAVRDYGIQHDATISQGSSGGPVLNIHGEVIGMQTYKSKTMNFGFAVNINH